MRTLIAIVLVVGAPAGHAQTGWSAKAQDARMRKEDDAFFRRLPNDPKKREQALARYLARPQHERILEGWKPQFEPKAQPKINKLKPGVNLVGRWQRVRGPLGAAFGIAKAGTGYAVNFVTWDPKGSVVFRRTGRLQGGTLTLDRPVFDVVDRPFTKVYVIAMGKGVRLIPSADVELYERLIRAKRNVPQVIAGLTFAKR